MTAQYILTVLLLVVSHGMEGKNLEFLFEKYIITEHFDEYFRGCPVEIKMCQKPLNRTLAEANDSKFLVPAVIFRNRKEKGETIRYISEEIFENENKVVMAFGNKAFAWTLDTIVEKDGKTQELIWSNNGQRVVFTRKESNADLLESAFLEEVNPKVDVSLENVKPGNSIFETEQIGQTYSNTEFDKWERKIANGQTKIPFGKYVITEHFNEKFLWNPVHIDLDFSSMFHCKSKEQRLSPVVVMYKGKEKRKVRISEEIFNKEHKIVMGSGPQKFTLDLIVYEGKRPTQLVWTANHGHSRVVFTRKDFQDSYAAFKSKLKSVNAYLENKCLAPKMEKTEEKVTESRTKEQNLLVFPNSFMINSSLAWTSPPEIDEDYRTGEDMILDEKKILGDLLPSREGNASNYESEQKYLKNRQRFYQQFPVHKNKD